MKDATEQRNKEPQGTTTETSSSGSSGMVGQQRNEPSQAAGKPQGSSVDQGQSRELQGMRPDGEKTQSPSGISAGARQQGAQAQEKKSTNAELPRSKLRGINSTESPERSKLRSIRPVASENDRQLQRHGQRGLGPRSWFGDSYWMDNPFSMMRRFSDEMDRLFEDVWSDRGMPRSRQGGRGGQMPWSPQVEMYQKDNQLVICIDLPGLKQEDIQLEVSEDMLRIQGERRNEFEDSDEGYYRSERSYGSFSRMVSLPDGIDAEQAKAAFENGVLKVTFPLPQQHQQQKRRIEIGSGSSSQTRSEGQAPSSQASSTPPRA